jgi:hypothetical protein
MATDSVIKSASNTLSTTTVDTINLKQWWDQIEVSNQGTSTLTVTLDGTTPTALMDNAEVVEAGAVKLFRAVRQGNGIAGDATYFCHIVKIIGNGNAYSVVGVAGQ